MRPSLLALTRDPVATVRRPLQLLAEPLYASWGRPRAREAVQYPGREERIGVATGEGKTMRAPLLRLAQMAKRALRRLRPFEPGAGRDRRRDEPQQRVLASYATPLPQSRRPPYAALRQ